MLTKKQKFYKECREAGLCGFCARPSADNGKKSLCEECRQNNLDRAEARMDARRMRGRCPYCGRRPVPDNIQCAKHIEMHQRWRKTWIKKKLCLRCGKERKPGYRCCEACYQRVVIFLYNQRKARIKAGCCSKCGKPVSGEFRMCKGCRIHARLVWRKRNA